MISEKHVAWLSLGVTAIVWLAGVLLLGRQPLGMTFVACAAGALTLGWGTFLRSRLT